MARFRRKGSPCRSGAILLLLLLPFLLLCVNTSSASVSASAASSSSSSSSSSSPGHEKQNLPAIVEKPTTTTTTTKISKKTPTAASSSAASSSESESESAAARTTNANTEDVVVVSDGKKKTTTTKKKTSKSATVRLSSISKNAWMKARRMANLGGLLGSVKNAPTPYDRVAGHPVFQVTTSWGAPYMSFEMLDPTDPSTDMAYTLDRRSGQSKKRDGRGSGISSGIDDLMENDDPSGGQAGGGGNNNNNNNREASTMDETRPVALFYMDPDDALRMQEEMKQLESLQESDIRITTTTLAKAIRQSSHFLDGLPTGSEIDPFTGRLKSIHEGGSLRYKIIPPRRELYYAARCKGKERVGVMSDKSAMALISTAKRGDEDEDIGGGRGRGRDEDEFDGGGAGAGAGSSSSSSSSSSGTTKRRREYGIPVFYAPEMHRRPPFIKRMMAAGFRDEKPLYFSYEDLMESWNHMRSRVNSKRNNRSTKNDDEHIPLLPLEPSSVEVFNLMDVLTSMERENQVRRMEPFRWKEPVRSVKDMANTVWKKTAKKTMVKTKKNNEGDHDDDDGTEQELLHDLVFIPSSRCTAYKEKLTARGDGKARLRPSTMR